MQELNFEQYLNDFNSTINVWHFILNVAVVTIIALIVKVFYIKFGRAISNREKFASTFIPLALSTLLIITVIKSSVALSLGLVGALSIVRFRAAIKDPEELTFLFLVIGLGLIGGANKPILAVVSFAIFLPILYLNNRVKSKRSAVSDKATLHISTSNIEISELINLIAPHTKHLQLKRSDKTEKGISASFLCLLENGDSLSTLISNVNSRDEKASIKYVDEPDLLL